MLVAVPLSFLALILVPALAVKQVSFGNHHSQDKNQVNEDRPKWNLDELPDPNNTDHLVFETVHSLLQRWPNTRMRNGHNIVPGIIPKGTVFYHAANHGELPSGPEWVATDPEHAHVYCVDPLVQGFQQTCTLFSLTATRVLKVVYFDGNSGANVLVGTMDTQELIAWGKLDIGDPGRELRMIQDLCKWGSNFGVDGFVRMEMDFEVVLCDFTSVTVVSSVDLASRGALQMLMPGFITFEVVEAGSWHNYLPGETRIQLDLAGLVSFYDTQLVPSLVTIRAGQERWYHRVGDVSNEDLSAIKSRLEVALMRPDGATSGTDWRTLIQVVVDRYAGRLELTHHLLSSSATDSGDFLDLANKVQDLLRTMLMPYLVYSATPTNPLDKTDLDWAVPIYELCATAYTKAIESELGSMTDSEKLLFRAVRGTNREICRVVTRMWIAGVYAGIDSSLNTKESPDIVEVIRVWSAWEEDLNRLMVWLDWSVWVKCNPSCGPEEMCYLPTWPIFLVGRRRSPLHSDLGGSEKATDPNLQNVFTERLESDDDWARPQPRCIRRIAPFEF